jgi:hypothetical protein
MARASWTAAASSMGKPIETSLDTYLVVRFGPATTTA